MKEDRGEVERRAQQKELVGRRNEAIHLRRRFAADERLAGMFDAAARAGRAEEFVETYEYAQKRRKGEQLSFALSREGVMDHLLPFALSDSEFARKRAANTAFPLTEEEARRVAADNRRVTRALVQQRLDREIDQTAQTNAANVDLAKRGRVRIDTTAPPEEVNPLAQDPKGRFGRITGHRDARSPLGALRLGASRAWRKLGGRTHSLNIQTPEDQALHDLKEKYGIEVKFENQQDKRRRAATLKSSGGRRARAIAQAPFRAVRASGLGILASAKVAVEGWRLQRREARLTARLASAPAAERAGLEAELSRVRSASPWTVLGVKSVWGLLKVVPRKTLLTLAFLGVSLAVTMTQALGMATVQALSVVLVTVVNYLIAVVNAGLALGFGLLLILGNLLLGLVSGILGFFYDSLWTYALEPISRVIPDVHYVKPVLSFAGTSFPQAAYWVSVLHPTIHDDGRVDYSLTYLPVDADGIPLGEPEGKLRFWYMQDEATLKLPRLTALECDPGGRPTPEACRPVTPRSLACAWLGSYHFGLVDCRKATT